jgi:hypothetical protein
MKQLRNLIQHTKTINPSNLTVSSSPHFRARLKRLPDLRKRRLNDLLARLLPLVLWHVLWQPPHCLHRSSCRHAPSSIASQQPSRATRRQATRQGLQRAWFARGSSWRRRGLVARRHVDSGTRRAGGRAADGR